jgi:hypothetical protein
VLPRERVVRAQLGEDRDHHLAQVLAGLGVGAGERLLERLERGGTVVAVPRRERLVQATAVA